MCSKIDYLTRRAKKHPECYEMLSECYADGIGVEIDTIRAWKYADLAENAKTRDRKTRLRQVRRVKEYSRGMHLACLKKVPERNLIAWELAETKAKLELSAACASQFDAMRRVIRSRRRAEQAARRIVHRLIGAKPNIKGFVALDMLLQAV